MRARRRRSSSSRRRAGRAGRGVCRPRPSLCRSAAGGGVPPGPAPSWLREWAGRRAASGSSPAERRRVLCAAPHPRPRESGPRRVRASPPGAVASVAAVQTRSGISPRRATSEHLCPVMALPCSKRPSRGGRSGQTRRPRRASARGAQCSIPAAAHPPAERRRLPLPPASLQIYKRSLWGLSGLGARGESLLVGMRFPSGTVRTFWN